MITIMRKFTLFYRVLSYLPLIWFLLFTMFVLRAYIALGRLPRYNNPDPENLELGFHYGITFLVFFITLCSPGLWFPLTILLYFKTKNIIRLLDVICYLFFYILFIVFLESGFRGLFSWFID